ncbi:hypothetical protein EIN_003110 [Entamoeba invadens IP1]|uniref:Uncharacterized protein n=1 Tax=Entamoeba invadens IP1 TaxID=370355 RepID=A0A0A1TW99_ENTIV|nr:hypothetical protein EIN_003110 [Entamoeba invadens IP1]ELP84926.1 hypothetical protein EIN_003110 [Entamoeba invadens IP1]|eukprot:XP_004184272.1 hypothetical protein EIN_003110 [Entamoeba invadens IP1]
MSALYTSKPLTFSFKLDLFIQCCLGVQWFHEILKLVHGNIKPSNFLLNEKFEIKLSDFNYSTDEEDSTLRKKVNESTFYCPPEVLDGTKNTVKASDIYSLGMTLWEVIYELSPFNEWRDINSPQELSSHLKEGLRPFLLFNYLENNCGNDMKSKEIESKKVEFDYVFESANIEIENAMKKCWVTEEKKRVNITTLLDTIIDIKRSAEFEDDSAAVWWKKNFEKKQITQSVSVNEFVAALKKSDVINATQEDCITQYLKLFNEVDLKRFEYLLDAFGHFFKSKPLMKKMESVVGADWFFPNYTKDQATSQIESEIDGTFLIRESKTERNSPCTLTKREKGKTVNSRITCTMKGKEVEYSIGVKDRILSRTDLKELIERLQATKKITTPCSKLEKSSFYK